MQWHILNIVFIRMFLALFSNKNNYNKIQLTENWNIYFSNNNIIFKIVLITLTFIQILLLFLFNLVCNLIILKNIFIIQFAIIIICYYRNCLIKTHMCVHPVSAWSVFFNLQCELFTSCNVSNNVSLVSAGTGGRGGSQPNVDRPGQGEGRFQKFPNLSGHPLWMTPTLIYGHTLRLERKFFCRYCLQYFRTAEKLKSYIKDCFRIHCKQTIKIPKKGEYIKFKNFGRKIKSAFMIYAPFKVL